MRPAHRFLAFSLLLTLCGLTAPVSAQEVQIIPDVVYGHKDGMALTFDVLKPGANANGAAVLYMVSGGWVSSWSPPAQAATRFKPLLDKGITVFVVRHSSAPRYVVPELVPDVKRATRYIRYHAAEWGVDKNRLGAYGGSAGGHLALMLGTSSDDGDPTAEEAFLRESHRVAAVVAYYPPVDLRTWARGVPTAPPPPNQRFPALNFAREQAPDISPILFVTPDDPPTLLIHGTADTTVPLNHSERIYASFQEAKVPTELIVLEGAGHGFRGDDATRATEAMVAWFVKELVEKN